MGAVLCAATNGQAVSPLALAQQAHASSLAWRAATFLFFVACGPGALTPVSVKCWPACCASGGGGGACAVRAAACGQSSCWDSLLARPLSNS